jgi:hypothetical protein
MPILTKSSSALLAVVLSRDNDRPHQSTVKIRGGSIMPEINPEIADDVPWSDVITPYDEAHFIVYVRLLDAEADGADWQEVAKIVLHRDPATDAKHAHKCWVAHLNRAKWMTTSGHRELLCDSAGDKAVGKKWLS